MGLRPYQETAVERVIETWREAPGRGALLVMATGCHPAGTEVLMHDGTTRPVEYVEVGDLLMGPDSTPRRVVRLVRGEDEAWEVMPVKGEPWGINPDHILTLYRTPSDPNGPPSRREAVVDVPAREWAGWSKTAKHRHKLLRAGVDFTGAASLPVDPWLLGVILGDGSSDGCLTVTKPDEEILSGVEAATELLGLTSVRYQYANRCGGIRVHGARAVLEQLGLWGVSSGGKFIPQRYKTASMTDRLEVLAGLMDTDGCATPGGYDYISKSRRLADDVAFVARSLGLAAYVSVCQKTCQGGFTGTYYRVSLSGDCSVVPCRLPRKRVPARRQKKNHLVTGFDIRKTGERAPYFGFALDGDHRYLLADFTVTHNCGKTRTGMELAVRECLDKGGRLVWLAHRSELVIQAYRTLVKGWPKHGMRAGIVQAGRDSASARAVFASVMTLAQPARLARLLQHGAPTMVVVDEAHHAPSASHTRVIRDLCTAGGARLLGLTATPEREDGKDLAETWEIAYSYGIMDAIAGGWLVEPYAAHHVIDGLDLSKVSGRRDYDEAELAAALLKAHIVEHTVAAMDETLPAERLPWRDNTQTVTARGRSCLVFTVTVEQARQTAEALCAAGWRAGWVCGETPAGERARLLSDFEGGRIEVLCNAAVLTEGTDLPRCGCIVLARPTKSWSLFVQMVGRGLRLYDPQWFDEFGPMRATDDRYRGERSAVILDLTGATRMHSLVSAPVLIGGSPCDDAPDGIHVFERYDHVKARCKHCGTKRACIDSIEAGKGGAHDFGDTGRCRYCGKAQCAESDDLRHKPIPQPDHKVMCMVCGAEWRDPLAGMLDRDRGPESTDDSDLLRLEGLTPETWAVDLDRHGVAFIVGDRAADRWEPLWVPKNARKPRKLTDGPVEGRLAWAITKDVLRKATRQHDSRKGVDVYGGHATDRDRERARGLASSIARRIGIARLAG